MYPQEIAVSVWQGTPEILTSLSLQLLTSQNAGHISEVGVGLYSGQSRDPVAWLNDHTSSGLGNSDVLAFSNVRILTVTSIAQEAAVFFSHDIFDRPALSMLRGIGTKHLAIVIPNRLEQPT